MSLPRISPARCTGAFSDSLLHDPSYVAEEKLDGSRYQFLIDTDSKVYFYSRRDYPKINKAPNVPHIAKLYPGLEGTILDGEIVHPNATKLGDTTRVMLSLPSKAVAEQEKSGKLAFRTFDILYWAGQAKMYE